MAERKLSEQKQSRITFLDDFDPDASPLPKSDEEKILDIRRFNLAKRYEFLRTKSIFRTELNNPESEFFRLDNTIQTANNEAEQLAIEGRLSIFETQLMDTEHQSYPKGIKFDPKTMPLRLPYDIFIKIRTEERICWNLKLI
jgi:hypothetical protein